MVRHLPIIGSVEHRDTCQLFSEVRYPALLLVNQDFQYGLHPLSTGNDIDRAIAEGGKGELSELPEESLWLRARLFLRRYEIVCGMASV